MKSRVLLVLLVLCGICLCEGVLSASSPAAFGFRPGAEGFSVSALEENGSQSHQAGSHPYELRTEVNFNLAPESPGEPGVPFSDGDVRDLRFDLPPGLIENPAAVPQCPQSLFHTPRGSPNEKPSLSGESCPERSQVGVVTVHTSREGGETRSFGVFNLKPPPGAPSEIGFNPFGAPIHFSPEVRQTEGEYQLSLLAHDIPQQVSLNGIEMTIWGAPWKASHDPERGDCLNEANPILSWGNCSVGNAQENPALAYLTMPSTCSRPLAYAASASSWQQPQQVARRVFSSFDQGEPVTLEGCDKILFGTTPQAVVKNPRAASPSGFDFNLDVDSEGLLRPKRLNPTAVKKAVVALPEGMTINPSVGSGLLGCTSAQYAAETVSSAPGAGCPNGSKIGDFTVKSPLFEETVEGSLFLAAPSDNPFGNLIAVYLVAKAPTRGILVKVAGKLDADPASGQLVATIDHLPQLPYSDLRIHFREGQRSPLTTPARCGIFETAIDLTPWTGVNANAHSEFPTAINAGPEGTSCPQGPPTFTPGAVGGSINSHAGSFSPFYLHLTRSDTEQEVTSYSATFPPGLTGKVAGIPYCSDAAIAAARARGGFEELERPSCPADTSIGYTVAGYGVGPALNFARGGLYLAGPFHGSTFSVVAIDSATVGPFDLGTVVVRSAIHVDPQTARVTIDSAGSDPIPHIIDGIPLHLRDIRVYISRHDLTVNPTSCEPFSISSTMTGSGAVFSNPADDTSAVATAPYQAFDCESLGFKPRFTLRLRGGTRRGDFPALRAELRPRPGDANIGAAVVALPASEFLEQGHIRTVCTRAQFARQACPSDSIYGSARAFSPLLAQPLEGNVYLRSSGGSLPDLVADIRGGGLGLAIEVVGRIDSVHGGLRGTFENLPDAPVSRFVMNLKGGKSGLLVNSEDVCKSSTPADARFIGQNNAVVKLRPRLQAKCGKQAHRARRGREAG
jgi:hypothetical protein